MKIDLNKTNKWEPARKLFQNIFIDILGFFIRH